MNENNANRVMELWKSINISETPIKEKLRMEIINQIASTFTVGKYYFMVFNFNGLNFDYVDPVVNNLLSVDAKDWNLDTFFSLVHPDDLEKLYDKESTAAEFLYTKITKEEITFYKVVYLLRLKDLAGNYKTILHQSRAINVSDDGKIQQVLAIHSDVTF